MFVWRRTYLGEGSQSFEREHFTVGKEGYDKFTLLGRQSQPHFDYTITLRQNDSDKSLGRAFMPQEKGNIRGQTYGQRKHDYRSIVGQLAWSARETMPQLSYSVSELQQDMEITTVGDIIHASVLLNVATKLVPNGHKCQVPHLDQGLWSGCIGNINTKSRIQVSHQ